MLKQIFCNHSQETDTWSAPIFLTMEQSMLPIVRDMATHLRSEADELNRIKTNISIWYFGTFDDTEGKFDMLINPTCHMTTIEVARTIEAQLDKLQEKE